MPNLKLLQTVTQSILRNFIGPVSKKIKEVLKNSNWIRRNVLIPYGQGIHSLEVRLQVQMFGFGKPSRAAIKEITEEHALEKGADSIEGAIRFILTVIILWIFYEILAPKDSSSEDMKEIKDKMLAQETEIRVLKKRSLEHGAAIAMWQADVSGTNSKAADRKSNDSHLPAQITFQSPELRPTAKGSARITITRDDMLYAGCRDDDHSVTQFPIHLRLFGPSAMSTPIKEPERDYKARRIAQCLTNDSLCGRASVDALTLLGFSSSNGR